jgi:hypothetical protein
MHPEFRVPGLGAWNSALRTKFDDMKIQFTLGDIFLLSNVVPSPKSQGLGSRFWESGFRAGYLMKFDNVV